MSESYYLPSDQLDKLRSMLKTLPCSPGVLRLDCEIPEHPSFFPGGHGYKGRSFPKSPVLFLGHNFDTCDGFYRSVKRRAECDTMPTWANLKKYFLPTAKLDEENEEKCFFTNLYLGAIIPEPDDKEKPSDKKEKKQKSTGRFKCSPEYRLKCREALRTQVEIVRPSVIALLGFEVLAPFAKEFPAYKKHLGNSLKDTQSKQPTFGHRLELLSGLQIQVVSLSHPSSREGIKSHLAQGALLGSAVQAASAADKLSRIQSSD